MKDKPTPSAKDKLQRLSEAMADVIDDPRIPMFIRDHLGEACICIFNEQDHDVDAEYVHLVFRTAMGKL